MANLSQSLSTCFFEKNKKDKNSGVGVEDDVAAAGYASADDALHKARERKKGVPWTEEEHRVFLLGLQKLGKGNWSGISRNFVPTRTPTQVASHAHKFFISGFENKIDEDVKNGGGDGDDGNDGGGRDDDKNGGGGGSGGNHKKESKDREGDGNGDKDKRNRYDGGENTKGKNMDFMGEAGFGYRYGYHAGDKNGYPVGQLNWAQKVQ